MRRATHERPPRRSPRPRAPGGAAKGEILLEVRNLKKHFPVTQGVLFQKTVGSVKAVDGV